MAELDSMEAAFVQVAIQAATTTVMALKEAETGLTTGTIWPTQDRQTDLGVADQD